jgi:predicted RNA binding protein YcfA (HicA-like mRNA interferase family)
MPKKLRELKGLLSKAGFSWRPGKGSHTVWTHPLLPYPVVLSGKDGADADRYHEKDVRDALRDLERLKQEGAEE